MSLLGKHHALAIALAASLAALTAGCGGSSRPLYHGDGKVAFADGKPLAGGWVEFKPVGSDSKVSVRGQIKEDGTFELSTFEPGDGAYAGEYLVAVIPPPSGNPDKMQFAPPAIHTKFGRFETSGLKFTVSPDAAKNEFIIIVTRPGGR